MVLRGRDSRTPLGTVESRYRRAVTTLLKSVLEQLAPGWLVEEWRRHKLARIRRHYSRLSLREVFIRIYETRAWGGPYCSGSGSDPTVNAEYLDYVSRLIAERGVRTVVDLGCGDFRIGAEISKAGVRYEGVDIVPDLIARNRREFGGRNVHFHCLNIVEDNLPSGELCIVRQVLQHLTNAEIEKALERLLEAYRLCLVTEHIPSGEFIPNLDKPHGPDIRLCDGSGVMVDEPPFSRPCEEVVVTSLADGTLLRTTLLS